MTSKKSFTTVGSEPSEAIERVTDGSEMMIVDAAYWSNCALCTLEHVSLPLVEIDPCDMLANI